MLDAQYEEFEYQACQIKHCYPKTVTIFSDPTMLTILAKLGHPSSQGHLLNIYLKELYTFLLHQSLSLTIPAEKRNYDTRMKEFCDEGVYSGPMLSEDVKLISVALARAGTMPSQYCYEFAQLLFKAEAIRQDHFYINRKINKKEQVVGVDVSGSKIGGDISDAYIVIPDPMGATGGTLEHVVSYYKEKLQGRPLGFIALHLIVTPEYLKRMNEKHPDVKIFSLRLDRGLSEGDILSSLPGTYWEKEIGLNSKQYIVPGAGGIGEILNNSFV